MTRKAKRSTTRNARLKESPRGVPRAAAACPTSCPRAPRPAPADVVFASSSTVFIQNCSVLRVFLIICDIHSLYVLRFCLKFTLLTRGERALFKILPPFLLSWLDYYIFTDHLSSTLIKNVYIYIWMLYIFYFVFIFIIIDHLLCYFRKINFLYILHHTRNAILLI